MGVLIKIQQNWACKHLKQQLRRKEPMRRTISECLFINKSQESSKKTELAIVPTRICTDPACGDRANMMGKHTEDNLARWDCAVMTWTEKGMKDFVSRIINNHEPLLIPQ